MTKFTVSRKRWLRGEGSDASTLLRQKDSKMCCLGFFAMQVCGAKESDIYDLQAPSCAWRTVKWPEKVWRENDMNGERSAARESMEINGLMQINDEVNLSEIDREAMLKEDFKAFGYEVEFVD